MKGGAGSVAVLWVHQVSVLGSEGAGGTAVRSLRGGCCRAMHISVAFDDRMGATRFGAACAGGQAGAAGAKACEVGCFFSRALHDLFNNAYKFYKY